MEKSARYKHIAGAVGHRLYVWGGWTKNIPIDRNKLVVLHDKETYLQQLDVLDLNVGAWKSLETKGTPHPGVIGAASCVIGEIIILFGGYCGHDACYYNTVTELNTNTLTWDPVQPDTERSREPPLKRAHSAMISFTDHDDNTILCIIGGEGLGTGGPWATSPANENIDFSEKARSANKDNDVHCFNYSEREHACMHACISTRNSK